MTKRSRSASRSGLCPGSDASEDAVSKSMTLREAVVYFSGADEADLVRLRARGYRKYQLIIQGAPETDRDRNDWRLDQLHALGKKRVLDGLAHGELLATGRDPRQLGDAPRIVISPDRWAYLTIDEETWAAIGDGVRVTEILVSLAGGLVIQKSARRARLGTVDLLLSPRSFDMLVMLAEGAKSSRAPIKLNELRDTLFQNVYDEKAPGQGIAKLRRQLVTTGFSMAFAKSLIVTVPREGYLLNLKPEEIHIDS